MNLQENIHRIHQMMGVINEDNRGESFKNMINKHGLYYSIKLMGGFDYSMEDFISNEDKIKFIKEVVSKLCEKYDDVEVASFNLDGVQIEYYETDEEKQVIEYYREELIIVERYTKEEDSVDYDYDDFYLGSFEVPYEELTHSLINEIFYLMLEQI